MIETGFWLGITLELKKVKRDISSSSNSSSSSSSCSSRTFVLSPRFLNRFRTPVAKTGSVCPVCSNASRIFDVIVCILYVNDALRPAHMDDVPSAAIISRGATE
jgi:hypothetical protein